ncbi:hypothetical protein [Nitrosomonas sp. Nm58]|uniref:hypothetical protein n=1 Tax=Nitrosomonas sp. Nm58 TaxID=200126 RepID=UPI00089BCC45|nr:hypothetical protein [Nitrosomonas sp. Nm58]SDY24662.1 hypothetical protein SAMN05421754_100498 [Nitrosomonas sp. Nm58]
MFNNLTEDQIILEQLHCAIELFLQNRFIPAITLAGAAEEILGKMVKDKDLKHAQDIIIDFIIMADRSRGRSAKQIRDDGNRVRNCLKHGIKGEIKKNIEVEAFIMIQRAIENYQRLGKPKTKLMDTFTEASKNIG